MEINIKKDAVIFFFPKNHLLDGINFKWKELAKITGSFKLYDKDI